jgi:hypothetical protein
MIDYSYGDVLDASCENCGASTPYRGWIVIDAEAAPGLLDEALRGAINSYTCRQCSFQGIADIPVILYRAAPRHPVIISPRGSALSDTAGSIAFYFISELGERLGKPDLAQQVADSGLPVIPRANLGSALRPGPTAPPTAELTDLVAGLVSARTWAEVADLVERNPRLASAESAHLLDEMAARLSQEGRAADAQIWERRRDFIRAVQAVGLAQAIKDVTGLTTEQLRAQTSAMDPAVFQLLEEMRAAGVDPLDDRQREAFLKDRPVTRTRQRRTSN